MDEPLEILFICTGNICRSPMAEGLLRHQLAAHEIKANVSSTGITAEGWPASPNSVTVMADRGIDIDDHRSRVLEREQLDHAHLVLGLDRGHAREALELAPEAIDRTFTVKEFVRRAAAAGHRESDEAFADWLRRVGGDRTASDLVGAGFSAADDVADPIGLDLATYEDTAVELEALIDQLVVLIWPNESQRERRLHPA